MALTATVGCLLLLLALGVPGAGADIFGLQYPRTQWRLMNCFLGAEDLEDCDVTNYWSTIYLQAAPAFFVATVIALVVPSYCVSKYLFNCCGGRKQSPNFFFPVVGFAAKYGRFDLLRPVMLAVVVFVLCLVASVMGIAAQRRLDAQDWALRVMMEDTVRGLVAKDVELSDALVMTLYRPDKDVTFNVSLLNIGNASDVLFEVPRHVLEMSRMFNETIINLFVGLNKQAWVPYLLFSLSMIVSLAGMMLALCNYRRYVSMLIMSIMTVLAVFAWGCNGLYASSFFHVKQGCFEVAEFGHRRENLVKAVVQCNDTEFSRYTSAVESLLQEQMQSICRQIEPHCFNPTETPHENAAKNRFFDCPPDMSCLDLENNKLFAWFRHIFCVLSDNPYLLNSNGGILQGRIPKCISAPGQRCDLRACARTLAQRDQLSDAEKVIKKVLYAVNGLAKARSTLDTVGSQLGSCDAVLANVVPALRPLCETGTSAAYDLLQSTGLLGVALILALYAYGMGAKRFIPFEQAFIPQND